MRRILTLTLAFLPLLLNADEAVIDSTGRASLPEDIRKLSLKVYAPRTTVLSQLTVAYLNSKDNDLTASPWTLWYRTLAWGRDNWKTAKLDIPHAWLELEEDDGTTIIDFRSQGEILGTNPANPDHLGYIRYERPTTAATHSYEFKLGRASVLKFKRALRKQTRSQTVFNLFCVGDSENCLTWAAKLLKETSIKNADSYGASLDPQTLVHVRKLTSPRN